MKDSLEITQRKRGARPLGGSAEDSTAVRREKLDSSTKAYLRRNYDEK